MPVAKKPIPRRKRLLRLLAMCSLFYIALCAAIAWTTVAPRRSRLRHTPAEFPVPFELVRFSSADSTLLSGWLIPATVIRPRGIIIFCHGVDSTRVAMLGKARILLQKGYAAFLFDFRARGESGGDRCTLGLKETDDLIAAVHYLQGRRDTATLQIGVLGESMGGAAALMAAARCPAIRAVVAESPFASLDHPVNNHFRQIFGPMSPLVATPVRWFGERLIGASCEDIAPLRIIGRIAPRPILLIQDDADVLCPPEETAALMRAAGRPKTLWHVSGAGHIQALYYDEAGFTDRVTGFFNAALHQNTQRALQKLAKPLKEPGRGRSVEHPVVE